MKCIRPAMLYGNEAWYVKEGEMGFYEGQIDPW